VARVIRRVRSGLLREAHGVCQREERHDNRQEEIFGPVLCVIAYDSEDEAIRIANDSNMVSTPPSLGPTFSARVAWPRRYGPGAW
jgi:hypothetical protein